MMQEWPSSSRSSSLTTIYTWKYTTSSSCLSHKGTTHHQQVWTAMTMTQAEVAQRSNNSCTSPISLTHVRWLPRQEEDVVKRHMQLQTHAETLAQE